MNDGDGIDSRRRRHPRLYRICRACSVFSAAAVFFIDGCNFGGALASVTVLLFGFCLLALIEGILLRPYSFFWVVLAGGITLFIMAKVAPNVLGRQS
jgi:hypothetical protein